MSRERTVEGFVLKKQDFNETDQIITIFSKEEGKIRTVVKAANSPTSKLRPNLQPLFQSKITLTGSGASGGLGKVIRAQPLKAFGGILQEPEKLSAWFVIAELIMRALPDSAPNLKLFNLLEQFAQFLHETTISSDGVKTALTQFQIKAMATLGLGIKTPSLSQTNHDKSQKLGFSQDQGGFVNAEQGDGIAVSDTVFHSFVQLEQTDFSAGQNIPVEDSIVIEKLVNRFVSFQLEREIKSQRYMV